MNIKRKRILSICLVLVLISIPYVAFVRDWSKPTFIDEHWLECTVDKINSYNELSDIYDDLIKDGDFFILEYKMILAMELMQLTVISIS